MSHLQISLLGTVQVVNNRSFAKIKMGHGTQALLAFLLLNRHRSYRREVIINLLWGTQNEKRARRCLSTTLWRLRQVLEPEDIPTGTYLLTPSTDEICFNPESDYWLDVAVFEQQITQALSYPIKTISEASAQALQTALQLYKGDLLEGFYDDWILSERERLRIAYLKGLAYLMQYYHYHHDHERSLACGQQILDADPLRENIHRHMIRLYLETGQRDQAKRQYDTCCHLLEKELGILPMPETQALYAQLVSTQYSHSFAYTPAALQQALQRLSATIDVLEQAKQQCQQVIGLVEQLIES